MAAGKRKRLWVLCKLPEAEPFSVRWCPRYVPLFGRANSGHGRPLRVRYHVRLSLPVARRGHKGNRLACSASALASDTAPKLGFAADKGLVDFDHPRQPAGDPFSIVHQFPNGLAKPPRGFVINTENILMFAALVSIAGLFPPCLGKAERIKFGSELLYVSGRDTQDKYITRSGECDVPYLANLCRGPTEKFIDMRTVADI